MAARVPRVISYFVHQSSLPIQKITIAAIITKYGSWVMASKNSNMSVDFLISVLEKLLFTTEKHVETFSDLERMDIAQPGGN